MCREKPWADLDQGRRDRQEWNQWLDFKTANQARCFRYWESKPLADNDRYQAYVRDLDRMLERKEEKMNAYLRPRILAAQNLTPTGSGEGQKLLDDWFEELNRGLEQERIREAQAKNAEATNQVSNSEHN